MIKVFTSFVAAVFFMGSVAFAQTTPSATATNVAKWIDQTKFSADVRYRQDWLKEDVNGNHREGRYRHRLRARVGFHTDVDSQWSLGARLSTVDSASLSGGEPVSYNQTLEKNGSKKVVGWDLAYIQWKNEMNWMARAGKMVNPIYTPQGSQLIFDVDYTPEGVALQTPWFVTAGYILDDRSLTSGSTTKMDPQAWLWATQAKKDFTFGEIPVVLGAGYYHFFNVQGYTNLYTSSTTFPFLSNTSFADGATNKYLNPYQVAQLFGEVTPVKSLPLTLYADVIQNLAIGKGNFGWISGAKYGSASKAKGWEAMYSFRRTEADSTVSALNDSDFAGGRDQAYGHIVNLRYGLTDNVKLAMYYNRAWVGADHSDIYNRVYFDLHLSL